MDDKAALIDEIARLQAELGAALARQRYVPMLRSTLTMQQFKLMMLIRAHGGMTGNELAERLGVSLPTVSGIVDRLAERGLLERREDEEDRRVRRSVVSDAGERMMAEIDAAGEQYGRDVLEEVGVADLRALARGVAAVKAVLEARVDRA
ncbi:MarR family winged helix-turn-helix transcriptional regulator [Georgenia alba]|uniref:MarR family winged helix-turn-helix transcriptional regulator n=1 Tax=Georgenia alba TaxID=2233858 RepID=A0ABW2Q7T3_9MICO